MMSPTSVSSDSDESIDFPSPACLMPISSECADRPRSHVPPVPSICDQTESRHDNNDDESETCNSNEVKKGEGRLVLRGESGSPSSCRKSPTAVMANLQIDWDNKLSSQHCTQGGIDQHLLPSVKQSREDEKPQDCDASNSFRLSSTVMEEAKKKIQQARADRERSVLPTPIIPLLEMMLPHNRTLKDTETDFCQLFAPCATGSFYLNYNSSTSLSYSLDDSRDRLNASSKRIGPPKSKMDKTGKSKERPEVKSYVHCPRSAFNDVYGSEVSTDLMFEDAEGEMSFDARKDIEVTGVKVTAKRSK